MTEKELSGLPFLNRIGERLQQDLKQLKDDLYRLETSAGVKSLVLIHGEKSSRRYDISDLAVEIADLKESIKEMEAAIIINLGKINRKRAKIIRYIEEIEDPEIQEILHLKYVSGLKWREIGDEMHMSYNTARRKHEKYLKKIITNVT